MIDTSLQNFVAGAIGDELGGWDERSVRELAARTAPAGLGGSADWLIRGDAHSLWARWFLESLTDPQPFVSGQRHYAHLFKQVREAIREIAGAVPLDEQVSISRALSDLLWHEVERSIVGRRRPIDRETKLTLWELHPRCWICGAAFSEWAQARFLGEAGPEESPTPSFIDFYKPRGVSARDLRIEVEHVHPHSSGGTDGLENLRLACGWCNQAKSSHRLLYDSPADPRPFKHPDLGVVGVPHPFWVVRFLATRRRCEHPSGCDRRTDSSELTIAPRIRAGSPNPANLMVCCHSHDPIGDARLVAARYFARSRQDGAG